MFREGNGSRNPGWEVYAHQQNYHQEVTEQQLQGIKRHSKSTLGVHCSSWHGPQSPGWSPVPTQWSYGDGTEEWAKGSGLIKCLRHQKKKSGPPADPRQAFPPHSTLESPQPFCCCARGKAVGFVFKSNKKCHNKYDLMNPLSCHWTDEFLLWWFISWQGPR